MDTTQHTLGNLFKQLGLDGSPEAIEAFIKTHKLGQNDNLDEAVFWAHAQAIFIRECWLEDSDWTEIIDQLDTLLHSK